MKRILAATTALVASATVAHAGGLAAPTIEAPVTAPVAVIVAAPVVGAFQGGYVGGALTYGFASDYAGSTDDVDGFGAALRAGYDWQFGSWVLGLGAEYGYSDVKGTIAGTDVSLDDTKSVFARAGYALDTWLPYATLGYTWSGYDNGTTSVDLEGASYGLGVEKLFTANWSGFAEYTVNDFDDVNGVSDLDTQAVKLGVNYRF
ncbi:outer membrane protein [Ketogulonicigenium robustum]|uniref:Outer membrane protein n=1 Tax=Ketogulonicigenium robustum TaxID=92947 RepID=A0A1W6P0C9_9RHOB|nr:outer membrane beta-barrel protein [Ketogulonicigenium robustum]ARO14780.1 outer membrane protein [Ketogulonicigenium robustum]